jgi:hypothetical protein
MPLIEVTQSRCVSATIRLDSETATLIDQYAAFVHGSADDVVDKALNYVFAKDREFQDFLKSPLAAKAVPSLRVRRAGAADARSPLSPASVPVAGWRLVVSRWKRHPWYPKSPVRCCAPAESRHSTPRRVLPSYFGSSLATAENKSLASTW